jgi:hypothetical protein
VILWHEKVFGRAPAGLIHDEDSVGCGIDDAR